jgi:hypothetical protein
MTASGTLFSGGTERIAPLALINRQARHVNDVHSVPVLLGEVLVAIDFDRFRIRCIDHGELTMRHPNLQQLKEHIPDNIIVLGRDFHCASRGFLTTLAHKTNRICTKRILFQIMLFNIGGLPASGCSTEKKQSSHRFSPFI